MVRRRPKRATVGPARPLVVELRRGHGLRPFCSGRRSAGAAGSADTTIRQWDIATRTLARIYLGHEVPVPASLPPMHCTVLVSWFVAPPSPSPHL